MACFCHHVSWHDHTCPFDYVLYPQGDIKQLMFLMGDADAAREHCVLYPARCHGTAPKPPRSPKTKQPHEVPHVVPDPHTPYTFSPFLSRMHSE